MLYKLLDPEAEAQGIRPYGFQTLHYSTTPGWTQVDCGSWIRWLVSRIRSCADKLGGGRERDTVQRTAKRYDDDGDGKDVGLRLLQLAAAIMAARAASPTHKQTSNDKKKRGTGRKILAALRRVRKDTELDCDFND